MDDYKLFFNFVSNIVLSFSLALLMIFVFGRQNSQVYEFSFIKILLLRIGIAVSACGALLNIFTFSNPSWSEVIMNAGLACVFCWVTWFQYKYFVLPYKNEIDMEICHKKRAKKVKKTQLMK